MKQPDVSTAAQLAQMDSLIDVLRQLVIAFDKAREVGLPVVVPPELRQVCADIVERGEQPASAGGPGRPQRRTQDPAPAGTEGTSRERPAASASQQAGVSLREVPLRRLIWQVIDPGEEFTVTELTERLSQLGGDWSPTAVSNALGYWAGRKRLVRHRKGVYFRPADGGTVDEVADQDGQQDSPAGHHHRVSVTRREDDPVGTEIKEKYAM